MARKSLKFETNPLFGGPSLNERSLIGSPFRELSLAEIDVDPDQPRRVFDPQSLAQLAASIQKYGLLTPILVRPLAGGTYKVVAGERRFRAAKLAGLETIAAVVEAEEGGQGDTLAKQLVENLQREELSPMERALAVGQLKERYNWSIREIAANIGISKSLVQRSLEILELPEDLQSALVAGASESKVLLLAKVKDAKKRVQLLSQLERLSRVEIEKLVKGEQAATDKLYHGGTAKPKARSTQDERVINKIQKALGTRVDIQRKASDLKKGKLIVEFYSDDDLKALYSKLTS